MSAGPIDGLWEQTLEPRVLPYSWRLLTRTLDGAKYQHESLMTVITSVALELDGKVWLHVSLARRSRLPSWDDVVAVKNLFIGEDETALQVLPPRDRYINIHPHCLHLWHCLDGAVTPDFARGGRSI